MFDARLTNGHVTRSHILSLFLRCFAVLALLASLSGLARARDVPAIAHHSTDDGGVGFVLDLSGQPPRLRFDGAQEVLALWWRPAASGDRILVRDDGAVVLRANLVGGMTLFSAAFPNGVPVNYDRPAMPLEGPPPPIETVRDTALEMAARAQADFGVAVRFDGDWDRAGDDAGLRAVLFDAVQNTGAALRAMAAQPQDRAAVIAHLRTVKFAAGLQPTLTRQRNAVTISYALERGVAGRPSSYWIMRELRAALR